MRDGLLDDKGRTDIGRRTQVLTWFYKVTSPVACNFLMRWPTLQALQRAAPRTIREFYRRHNCRDEEGRIEEIRQAVPATLEPSRHSCQRSHGARYRTANPKPQTGHRTPRRTDRRLRNSAGTLRKCKRDSVVHRCCSRSQTKRQYAINPLPAGLSSFSTSNIPRMGWSLLYKSFNGRAVIMRSVSHEERSTMPPCAPLPSNGFGFCFAAGKTEFPMWKAFIWLL